MDSYQVMMHLLASWAWLKYLFLSVAILLLSNNTINFDSNIAFPQISTVGKNQCAIGCKAIACTICLGWESFVTFIPFQTWSFHQGFLQIYFCRFSSLFVLILRGLTHPFPDNSCVILLFGYLPYFKPRLASPTSRSYTGLILYLLLPLPFS